MSWHIFRKDVVLLWPLVVLSTIVQFGLNGLMFVVDQAPESPGLLPAVRLFVLIVFLAIALTISQAVHEDAVPGTRQDWLTRPIRRRDMLLAKLLFVVAAIQLPMFLGDILEMIAQGFSLDNAATTALSRNLYVFVVLSLPALGFSAITRNTVQLVGVAIAYFVAIAAATFLLDAVERIGEPGTNPTAWTGVAWVPQSLGHIMLALGALIAVYLLYIGRRIALAQWLFPIFAVLSALATVLPWRWAFAVEEAAAAPAHGVTLSIDPWAPRYTLAAGESLDDYSFGAAQVDLHGRSPGDIKSENRTRRSEHDVTVLIPMRISGLPPGVLPWVDRASVIFRTQNGRIVFRGRGDDLKFGKPQTRSLSVLAYEAIRFPQLVYEATKNVPLSVGIDYSLTVLSPEPWVSIRALDARAGVSGFGQCTTDRDSDGDEVELRCLKAGVAPSCIAATLEDPETGRRNPETLTCAPDYSPYSTKLFPDAISRFQVEAPFRDRLQLVRYPVGGAQLAHARLLLTKYDASKHISCHLTATQVRLAAWTANSGAPGPTDMQ